MLCAILSTGLAVSHPQLAAAAGILSQKQALPAQTIQQFLADPKALLRQYPNGGPLMLTHVRDLAASDPATLNSIVELIQGANPDQASAIGTALGQVALMAVKTDQAYATLIQEAIAKATQSLPSGGADAGASSQSGHPKIGSAVTTKDQVEGVTEKGTQPIVVGTEVYLNELVRTGSSGMAQLLFADRTNLSVGPVTEIRLDNFVYDPNAKSGNVVVVASEGAFRFITGLQPSQNYSIRTPFATLGIRGTEFIVRIGSNEEQIQLNKGQVIVTTISNKVVTLDTPNTVVTVDSHGNTQGPTPTNQPLVNFADLGAPVTNTSFASAENAFAAVTGSTGIGATGGAGGGGGGGEAPTGQTGSIGGGFGRGGDLNLPTFVTTPTDSLASGPASLTGGTGGNIPQSVSPQ